ncbi:hypothetical protein M9Y10_043224 [Tritrichomonas musculus]|uniref:Uncharacterized protein n=1 Tax=Tritrichomonas musculus TaxID=1915356 RepID=A0ABR2JZ40_9EUKA
MNVCCISANTKLLATMYNIKEGNVRKIMYKARQNKKLHGRPFIFDEKTELIIVTEIRTKKDAHEFMTQSQVLRYIEENFNKSLTYGWLNAFIGRHQDSIKKTVVTPQENLRLTVPRIYLVKS